MTTVFRKVNTPEPTEVAKELAQSFSPIPQALYKENKIPQTKIH